MSKNSEFNDIQSLFNVTKTLIMDNTEIRNLTCVDCEAPTWTIPTFLNDQAVQLAKAKVYVYSDSVLCLGKIYTTGQAIGQRKGQVATFRVENNSFNEILELDGEPIELEWKKFQDSQHWRFFIEFNAIWRIPTLNRNNSAIESFLCPYSLT